ncbi:Endonuclease/exonuclease/phosphatase [Pelagophyceae sp. CCMP2097]|nr:Endonuclease/exonuclease/phosphatase [Pelagophyceae sp. CCMP2097]
MVSAVVVALALGLPAARAALFFSESAEGSSNNKFIEIYNSGTTAVQLDQYALASTTNGGTGLYATWTPFTAGATISAGDVYVVCHPLSSDTIKSQCDQQFSGLSNGDDGICLAQGTESEYELLDCVGDFGPKVTAWDVCGTTGATKDKTLVRKAAITKGNKDWAVTTAAATCEWTVLPIDTWNYVGEHPHPELEAAAVEPTEPTTCTAISAIQGSGAASPLVGARVKVCCAVVVGVTMSGFFAQTAEGLDDKDESTSEGIFVFLAGAAPPAVGGSVDIIGGVVEFFGLTQLSEAAFKPAMCVASKPKATVLTLPAPSATAFEQYEGMLVNFVAASGSSVVVSEFFNLGRYGEFVACAVDDVNGRHYTYSQVNKPDTAGFAVSDAAFKLSCIGIDDGNGSQNPTKILLGGSLDLEFAEGKLRVGNKVFAQGPLTFANSAYKLAAADVTFDVVNPRPEVPTFDLEHNIVIAGSNVLNYFLTLNQPGTTWARGSNTPAEFARQAAKTTTALSTINADIFGIVELENGPLMDNVQPSSGVTADTAVAAAISSSQDIIARLNAANPARDYKSVTHEVGASILGTDSIRADIFYDANVVTMVGNAASIVDNTNGWTSTDKIHYAPTDAALLAMDVSGKLFSGADTSRSPLAATFALKSNGAPVTVVMNHLKSKGGSGTGPNADLKNGAGSWNDRRTLGAKAVRKWLDTHPTGVMTDSVVLLGDLNAYAQEDPVQYLVSTEGGFVSVEDLYAVPAPHSFQYDGGSGSLDWAMVDSSLFGNVAGAEVWHCNADEPAALDYNLDFGRGENYFDGSIPYRYADHDPPMLALQLAAIECASDDDCPSAAWTCVAIGGVRRLRFGFKASVCKLV